MIRSAIIELLWLVPLIVVSALIYVRMAPAKAEDWHVDPLSAAAPGPSGVLVRPADGDILPARHAAAPEDLLRRLDAIILATPRTRLFAGSLAEGRLTYVTRSRVFGFPDYSTVAVAGAGDSSAPVILARARFGRSDIGVNRARVTRWLRALEQAG